MTDGVDPDHMASSEAVYQDILCLLGRTYPGSAKQLLI